MNNSILKEPTSSENILEAISTASPSALKTISDEVDQQFMEGSFISSDEFWPVFNAAIKERLQHF